MLPNTARKAGPIVAGVLLLAGLTGCGSSDEQEQAPAAASLPSPAEIAALRGDRLIEAARDASRYEFYLHYKIMQTTGMIEDLGGEEQAIAALTAVSAGFERSATAAQTEVPRLVPAAAFDGSGLDAGVMGVGYGLFGGVITGLMSSQLTGEAVTAMAKAGPLVHKGADGSAELSVTERGTATTLDQAVSEKGLTGRVKTRINADVCPDAEGKLVVTIDTESQMSAGGKDGLVKISYRRERWVTDDARLGEEAAEDWQMEMSGAGSTGNRLSFAQRYALSRDGQASDAVTSQQGFDIFHLDDVRHTEQLREGTLNLLRLVADAMLMGMSAELPLESGRCVDLKLRSDPARRTGARPNTAYTLYAEPRAKLDGAPARGTVAATLDGENTLGPGGKIRADARFDYANPTRRDLQATVSFEARSRRGVGRAALEFDTREKRAFRVAGGQNDFRVDQVVCSVIEPFDLRSSAGIVMHMSGGEGGGRFTVSGSAGGVPWSGGGNYTLRLEGDGGSLDANGRTTISTPVGSFSDSVNPSFTLTPADGDC